MCKLLFVCSRLEEQLRELEKRKQLLLEKKRGSDSTQGSYNTPSKKSSICSMDSLLSPPLSKKVLRLQEYEEGGDTIKVGVDTIKVAVDTIKVGGDTIRENSSVHHSRTEEGERRVKEAEQHKKEADHRGDKIDEMERRLKESLEVELSTSRQESGSMFSHSWSKGSSSPMHLSDSTRSPSLNSWRNSTSPSDVRAGSGHSNAHTFGHYPLPPATATTTTGSGHHPLTPGSTTATGSGHYPLTPGPTTTAGSGHYPLPTTTTTAGSGNYPLPSPALASGSGFHDARRIISHSDSSEWTEFACASTSSGSVEVGGQIATTPIKNLSDFDPISTNSTDPSKPP